MSSIARVHIRGGGRLLLLHIVMMYRPFCYLSPSPRATFLSCSFSGYIQIVFQLPQNTDKIYFDCGVYIGGLCEMFILICRDEIWYLGYGESDIVSGLSVVLV